jgi:hypothetical protein
MKAVLLPEPERWSERATGHAGTSAEDVIGASLRQIRTATEPTDVAALRWARRAMVTPPRAAGGRIWSIAIAAAILAGGGAVAARVALRAAAPKQSAPPSVGEPEPARRRTHARAHVPPVTAPPVDVLPDPAVVAPPESPQAPVPPLPPSLKTIHAPPPARLPRAPTEPPPIARADAPEEARLVARAFRHLRSEGDAAAALADLEERERHFGSGTLATEAALARAEALLLLGRTDEALPILVGLRDPRSGLTPEVRAARAELLAKAKRCAEAITDFDALLAPGAPPSTRERALYGRASCRVQDGRTADAISDLESYVQQYPQGRFAPAVREALAALHRL